MNEVLKVDTLGKHKILVAMVGLPYSGKSFKAKQLAAPIVCPDTIRVALHGKKFVPAAEPYVWAIAKTMVKALFLAGHDCVVLDATNTTVDRRAEWLSKDWETDFCCIKTPVAMCITRAVEAGDDVMVDIIESMGEKLVFPDEE
jgi:predicted kinase